MYCKRKSMGRLILLEVIRHERYEAFLQNRSLLMVDEEGSR